MPMVVKNAPDGVSQVPACRPRCLSAGALAVACALLGMSPAMARSSTTLSAPRMVTLDALMRA